MPSYDLAPPPPPPSLSSASCLSFSVILCVAEPNHMTARKPSPLLMVQYSLTNIPAGMMVYRLLTYTVKNLISENNGENQSLHSVHCSAYHLKS